MLWLLDLESCISEIDKIARTTEHKKPEKQKLYIQQLRKAALPAIKLIFLVIICGLIVYSIINAIINFYIFWSTPGHLLFKIVIFLITVPIIGVSAYILYLCLILKITGYKAPEIGIQEKTDNHYELCECLFDIFGDIAQLVGLDPPSDQSDLIPAGRIYVQKGKTTLYRFSIRKLEESVNLEKIKRLVESELRKKLKSNDLPGVIKKRVIYHGRYYNPIIVIDITENTDYVKITLAYASEESCRLYEHLQKNRLNKTEAKNPHDGDF